MKKVLSSVLVALALCAGSMAVAEAAEATGNVNVRAGPGSSYAAIDVLQAGQTVDIDRCTSSGWCYVRKAGPDGWVSARYLTDDDAPVATWQRPEADAQFSIEGFSLSFGDGSFSFRSSRPSRLARACFYEDVNFGGDGFCLRPGQTMNSLGDWNDQISSIDIQGGAEALVCADTRYRGRCVTVSRDIRNLGRRGADQISSIKVR